MTKANMEVSKDKVSNTSSVRRHSLNEKGNDKEQDLVKKAGTDNFGFAFDHDKNGSKKTSSNKNSNSQQKAKESPPTFHAIVPRESFKESTSSFSISEQDVESGSGNLSLDDSTGRDTYDKPIEFLLSCISMSIGFGSIWRFPFTAYENGGGTFLITYLIFLALIGCPIYYFEMILGQFSSSGHIKVWAMAPIFKGVGYGSTFAVTCIISYYLMLVGIVIFYFIASFNKNLPWDQCNPEWTEYCYSNGTVKNQTTILAKLYYELDVFPEKENIDDGIGYPEWRLSLCLLLGWVFVFLSLVKGIKFSAKTTYFTALSPYVVMVILVIQGVTLKGAGKGIKYFIYPDWDRLFEPSVWFNAAGQCLFSLGAGMGAIIVLASYNPFRHNVCRDAIIMSSLDGFTSFLAGLIVFSVLGNLSETTGLPISEVANAGPGLAFVSYPAVIASFEWVPQLFGVLFFIMLFAIGIGSASGMTEGVITVICDQFPSAQRWAVTLGVCVIGFFIGLLYVTPGGQFLVTLVDRFGSTNILYLMVITEVAAVSWVYGLNNFCFDLSFMRRTKVSMYWKASWGFVLPVGLFVVFIYSMLTRQEFKHENTPFPSIAIGFGWFLTAFGLLLIPLVGYHGIVSRKAATFKEKFAKSLKPSRNFGPRAPRIRYEWEEWKKHNNC